MDDQTRGEKQVILIGIDSSLQSLYSLEWTLEHLIRTDDSYFKLVVLHVRAPAIAVLPFSSTGTGDIQTIVEVNLKRTAAAVLDQARDLCDKKSITDYELLVTEGDARHVLCEAVDKFHADMLVLGSHGAGSLRRAILGSVSDYCAHHAHCSLLIIKKPKSKSGKDHNHHLHWKSG